MRQLSQCDPIWTSKRQKKKAFRTQNPFMCAEAPLPVQQSRYVAVSAETVCKVKLG